MAKIAESAGKLNPSHVCLPTVITSWLKALEQAAKIISLNQVIYKKVLEHPCFCDLFTQHLLLIQWMQTEVHKLQPLQIL